MDRKYAGPFTAIALTVTPALAGPIQHPAATFCPRGAMYVV